MNKRMLTIFIFALVLALVLGIVIANYFISRNAASLTGNVIAIDQQVGAQQQALNQANQTIASITGNSKEDMDTLRNALNNLINANYNASLAIEEQNRLIEQGIHSGGGGSSVTPGY
jgi:hypothetical protein